MDEAINFKNVFIIIFGRLIIKLPPRARPTAKGIKLLIKMTLLTSAFQKSWLKGHTV